MTETYNGYKIWFKALGDVWMQEKHLRNEPPKIASPTYRKGDATI